MSPRAFSESIENARKLFDYARETFGIKMHFLDLGGGYPGSSDSTDLFNSIAKEINKALDEHFPADLFAQINGTTDDDHKLRIIAEPGRYYACSAFTLCVSVIAKRVMTQNALQQAQDKETALSKLQQQKALQSQLAKENEELPGMNKYGEISSSSNSSPLDTSKSIMYYVNDGVYASFNCLFYDHAECFPVLINEKHKARDAETTLYKSSIWGPTCDGLDVISKECFLPELETGEFMVFKNMGAYTISGAVPFNGIPLARCIYTASTSWNIIKHAFDEQPSEEGHAANMLIENLIMSPPCWLSFARNIHQQQQFSMDNIDINKNTFDTSDEENANEEMSNEDNGISANKQDTCAITC